jgi:hypothetical protein
MIKYDKMWAAPMTRARGTSPKNLAGWPAGPGPSFLPGFPYRLERGPGSPMAPTWKYSGAPNRFIRPQGRGRWHLDLTVTGSGNSGSVVVSLGVMVLHDG